MVQICATPSRRPLDIVAHLPPPLLAHLRFVAAREHQLAWADGWGAFDLVVRRTAADVAVGDPAAGRAGRASGGAVPVRRRPPAAAGAARAAAGIGAQRRAAAGAGGAAGHAAERVGAGGGANVPEPRAVH